MKVDGEGIKELSDRLQKPELLGDVIVAPPNWQFKHEHELEKAPNAFSAPACKVLQVATLGALRDYLTANRDGLDLAKLMVHVESPNRVTVGSVLREPARDRELYLTATAVDMTGGFVEKFHGADEFNIGLQVRFVPPGADDSILNQRNALIDLVSSVKTEQTVGAIDNGHTQTLEARASVAFKERQDLPNPVHLTPFRTFREVLQPSSPFVLRAKAEVGEVPSLCLFEADGGVWKLVAIGRVRDWLVEHLPKEVAVLA